MTYPTKERNAGLSLMEILVAVSILSILIALAIPATKAVGIKAKQVKCLGNLRQISTLMQNYLTDHNMVYPAGAYQKVENGVAVGALLFWGQALAEHGQLKDLRCFICPCVKDIHPSLKSNAGAYGFGSVSYAINRYGIGPGSTDSYLPPSHTSLSEPSRLLLLFDYDSPSQPYDGWYIANRDAIANAWETATQRHSGVINALFCDGHVESIREKQTMIGSSAKEYPWAEFQYLRRK